MTRDEREAHIDESADRLAYLVMSYGLLAIAAYRGLVEGAASWELLALVVLGGFVGAGYRIWRGVVTGRRVAVLALTVAAAVVVAALLVALRP